MNDAKDRILESCLEEVLGGQSPPELTSRIMQMFNDQSVTANVDSSAASASVEVACFAAAPSPAVRVARKRSAKRKNSKNSWLNAALAASILVAVISVGALAFQLIDRARTAERSLAVSPENQGVEVPGDATHEKRAGSHDAPAISDGRLVKRSATSQPGDSPNGLVVRENANASSTNQLAIDPGPHDGDVVALINVELQEKWRKHGVVPADPVSDQSWCDRVYKSILGRKPDSQELAAYLADATIHKRESLVDRLLADPAYTDQYATRFASIWNDLLIGPEGGRRQGDLANRTGLRQYLKKSFSENKPLDAMARELISATGSGKPGSADFDGAVNFLLAHVDSRGTTATAHTARVFLGSRVKCAQCHDHSADDEQLAQRDFWQLNSFFRQVDFERGGSAGEFVLVDRDFNGEGDDPNDAEVYFETPEGRLQVAYPVLGNQPIPTSGYVDQVNRREELAKLITHTDRFDRTVVNHFWKSFFSYGLPTGDKNDAQLVDALAEELRASGYDAKRLVRWIALSDAFALAGGLPAAGEIDSPEFGGTALFSRFYPPRSAIESVSTGLAAAAKAHADGSVNARMLWYGRFVPQDPTSIPSIGAELIVPVAAPPVIRYSGQEMIRKIAAAKLSYAEKVHHLFWATVTRNPNQQELKLADELYSANNENTSAALEAIWLVLTNSDEFVLE